MAGGDLASQAARARRFLDAYGASASLRRDTLDTVAPPLRALVEFMRGAADAGDAKFARDIADGRVRLYERDAEYVASNVALLRRVVVGAA